MKIKFTYGGVLCLSLLTQHVAIAAEIVPTIHAAGSLRSSIDDVVKQFELKTGIHFDIVYGPSGKLRDDIAAGKTVGVFASASTEHTEALVKEGFLKDSSIFARNSMCLLAAPDVNIDQVNLIDKMLDPATKLGTSTPKMDPGGDYAWMLFQNIEKIRPGTYSQLDTKAQKLVGNPSIPARSVLDLLRNHEVDLFVTYCSYAQETASKTPGITWKKFPASINVEATYGIGAAKAPDLQSDQLVRFILSGEGQKILGLHGFETMTKN